MRTALAPRLLTIAILAAPLACTSAADEAAPAGSAAQAAPAAAAEPEWVQLFNGKDLEGWTPKFSGHDAGVNYKDTFRVQDGLLTVSYDQYEKFDGEFGHLFYKDEFSHYVIRAEYRFVGEQVPGGAGWALRNNGLMLHGQKPGTMRKDQDFPVSIEVQLLGGDGVHERSTVNRCTPGTNVVYEGKLDERHCISSASKTFHGDQWVTAEIEVHGSSIIRHLVNGDLVMEYESPQLDPRDGDAKRMIEERGGEALIDKGTISIQAESHPTQFRKIEVKVLEP